MKIISLGVGVQTVALYYMSSQDEITRCDYAIFADTGGEKTKTLEYYELLLDWMKQNNGIPLYKASYKNLKKDLLNQTNSSNNRFASIPAFTMNDGEKGMLRRQCTNEYKITQVNRKWREIIGIPGRKGRALKLAQQRKELILSYLQEEWEPRDDIDHKNRRMRGTIKSMLLIKHPNGCVVCSHKGTNDNKLCAHHYKPHALFPHLRYLLSNQTILCQECHNLLHKTLGWDKASVIQQVEYIKNMAILNNIKINTPKIEETVNLPSEQFALV